MPAPRRKQLPPPNPKKQFGDKKPPLAQLPLAAQVYGALALYDGDNKYGWRNWRENPVEAMTYVNAIDRHNALYKEGENFTRDTRIHNLGAIIACASILIDAEINGTLIDDRSHSPAACDLLHDAEELVTFLNERAKAYRRRR